jgi:hypothetical protein
MVIEHRLGYLLQAPHQACTLVCDVVSLLGCVVWIHEGRLKPFPCISREMTLQTPARARDQT